MRTALSLIRVATLSALAVLTAMVALAFALSPAAAQGQTDIGYASPAAALMALVEMPGVQFSVEPGYIIVAEPAPGALWSFTDNSHPAHPAVVKRQVVERNGEIFIDMRVMCGASKAVCDQLVAAFTQLNEEIGQSLSVGR